MKTRRKLFPILTVMVLVAIAAAMMVIGRGHTVYFDNRTLEGYNGQDFKALHRIVVTVKGEEAGKLGPRERGMAVWIGQNFEMTLEVTPEKGDEPEIRTIRLKLPYNMDGIIVNLPAVLAGLPEDAWLSEFVPAVPEEPEEEPFEGDEFGFGEGGDMGLGDI
ncbi:MAG: hypothetical protein HFG00_04785 [Oscillibacter sp.]|nr:hypothetical protein [Oscillibacter sp.]